MTQAIAEKKHTQATTDFEEFYQAWLPKVRTAVIQAGFRDEYAEDLVQDIFTDLHKGGYLDKYDSERATFATYIWGHVQVRIRDRKRALWRRSQRETMMDMTDPESPLYYQPTWDDTSETELAMAVKAVYKELQRLPATESKNLARLFRDIVEMVIRDGTFNQSTLAAKYGVSRQAIAQQIQSLSKTPAMNKFKTALVGA